MYTTTTEIETYGTGRTTILSLAEYAALSPGRKIRGEIAGRVRDIPVAVVAGVGRVALPVGTVDSAIARILLADGLVDAEISWCTRSFRWVMTSA